MKLNPPRVATANTWSLANWFLIASSAAVLSISSSSAARQRGAAGMRPAEELVVAQAKVGGIADLSNEKDRKLSAHFLEDLLTDTLSGVKLHRHGVQIIGAIIDEPIDLKSAQIRCEVRLDHCQFNKNVTFDSTSFAATASFKNSAFKADAVFSGMKVGGNAFFSNAVFEGPVNFSLADIASDFDAQGTRFQDEQEAANFNSMKVRHTAYFQNAVFEGPVNFYGADIASELQAQGAKFQNKEGEANFNSIKVGHTVYFWNTVFDGPVNFVHAEIASNFEAQGAKFQNKEKAAFFSGMKVGGNVFFWNAVFAGPLYFVHADIASNFEAQRAKFQNKENGVFFNGIKVRSDALFDDATFEGRASFAYADINNFKAQRAKFQNKENGAFFSGMKIQDSASFNSAVFEGTVRFDSANIANNFNANEAMFQDEKNGAVFIGMKVGGDATFYSAVFNGPVDFNYADFARLSLSCPFSPEVAARFYMQGTSYRYIRAVPRPEPSYPLYPELVEFIRAVMRPEAPPRSHIVPARLSPPYRGLPAYIPAVPQFGPSPGSHKISLYREPLAYVPPVLHLEPESELREELLKLADGSPSSADVYSRLEEFFLRQGDRGDADKAFFAGKVRERKEYFRSGAWFRWLGSWMLDLLVGYGRQPWRAGIPCAVLVALGCFLFSPRKMEPQTPDDTPRVYNRFWYSLGLFLPFVDLQSNKVWKPKTDQTFLRNYMRVHILLGWILVPLVLAAVTGLIK